MKKYIFGIITGLLLAGGITAYASGLISGSDVSYDNRNSGITSNDINGALDELYGLYEGLSSNCPEGYKCKYVGICEYEIGKEWNFIYTGSIQNFDVPCEGVYKLEVWGAQGGGVDSSSTGGYGGYSVGYKKLSNEKLYLVVGGAGNFYGGYNGGGNAVGADTEQGQRRGGGGATHIALVSGTLASIGYDNFVTMKNGLIVAGGGGGGGADLEYTGRGRGSSGGGLTDSSGYASQTSGFAFGQGGYKTGYQQYGSNGGGGGLYGGSASSGYGGAGGGSGYIGGVGEFTYDDIQYIPSTTAGVNSGNGKAKITLIAR